MKTHKAKTKAEYDQVIANLKAKGCLWIDGLVLTELNVWQEKGVKLFERDNVITSSGLNN